ncbi:hypothetical protein GCM10009741_43590 [Kribbella lupini]|uniref:Uncharacterized protein n=1 Tax=Kribbella lupini TaxID=291602 RepID=A0ABP4M2I3_9ACTN
MRGGAGTRRGSAGGAGTGAGAADEARADSAAGFAAAEPLAVGGDGLSPTPNQVQVRVETSFVALLPWSAASATWAAVRT